MVKVQLLLGLVLTQVSRLALAQVDLDDLFTIQPGDPEFGGCSVYSGLLEVWHQECIDSMFGAMEIIETHYNQRTPAGGIVRKALHTWLKINTAIPSNTDDLKPEVSAVADIYENMWNYFEGRIEDAHNRNTFLFCSAGWLVEKNTGDDAQDYQGDVINDEEGPVSIGAVRAYADRLGGGDVPWWAGDHTELYGYHITGRDSGGNYCGGNGEPPNGNLGQTSTIEALIDGETTLEGHRMATVILCPLAFDTTMKPEQYAEAASDDLGDRNLHDALPKSTTLLHEAFHVLFGVGETGMYEGDEETYGLAPCAALSYNRARRNPENYVYLAAALHYYFGTSDDGISRNWDFITNPRRGRLRS